MSMNQSVHRARFHAGSSSRPSIFGGADARGHSYRFCAASELAIASAIMKPFIVSAVLHRLRRYPRWSWFGVLFYAAIVILPHENVQTWVGEIAKSVGRQRVYQVAASIAIIGAAAVTFAVLRRLREQTERRMLGGFWLLTLALVVPPWRLLNAHNTELVHYPQYMVEGAAILALTLSPVETLCWIALFGGLDEDFQYWILHGNWGIPYDFNDIYMDLLGGALGAVV